MLQSENVTFKTRRRRSSRDKRRNRESDPQSAQEKFPGRYNNERAGTSILFSPTFYDYEAAASGSSGTDYDIMPDIQESSVDDSVKLPVLTAKALEHCYPDNYSRFNNTVLNEPRKNLSLASRTDSEVLSLVGLQYVASCAASTEQHYQANEQDLSGFPYGADRNVYKDDDGNEVSEDKDCFINCIVS